MTIPNECESKFITYKQAVVTAMSMGALMLSAWGFHIARPHKDAAHKDDVKMVLDEVKTIRLDVQELKLWLMSHKVK